MVRPSPCRRAQIGVVLILVASYAYFWHSRDWNSASRLMLTYALGDRGTIRLNGLDRQTGDIAYVRGQYYCDKLPGFSYLGLVPYSLARSLFRLPAHPLDIAAMAYWPADYWVTLWTSGLFTAWTAALLVGLAVELGCTTRRAALVGLSYGLATPAYVYATLAYGHQVSAFALFASMLLIWRSGRGREAPRLIMAGFLAAIAAVVELQVGPVSTLLGLFLIARCLREGQRPDAILFFGIGALVPTLLLLVYNFLAFGSAWDMGYFHHATAIFAQVHNRQNPLGLRRPDWSLARSLLWGSHRGLLFYAPILALAPAGWLVLLRRKSIDLAVVTFLIVAAVFLVNLSYPEWTGGWSTGPRLLVPLLPFAMVPVAAVLADRQRWSGFMLWLAISLALGGGVLMLLFQGVGARLPQDVLDPLGQVVWPLWTGQPALPRWWTGERFARNLASLMAGDRLRALPVRWQVLQFLPLVLVQAMGIGALVWAGVESGRIASEPGHPGSDLGIDQQQQSRGANQDSKDPEAKSEGVNPDARP